jgi:CBS domain containing-hemolysin-like protein
MHGLSLLEFVAVGLLILANAFFVAAEFALVSIRDTRIQQMLTDGVPGGRAVRRLQSDLDDFLPAVQLGVTLCSLALGWIGEPLAAGVLMGWMRALPLATGSCPGLRQHHRRRARLLPSSPIFTWWWASWCPNRSPCAAPRPSP